MPSDAYGTLELPDCRAVDATLTLPLRTSRLVLREIVEADLELHADLFSQPGVVRYLYDAQMTMEELRAHFARRLWRGLPNEGAWCNLAVEHEGVFIGEVGLGVVSAQHRCWEVGYVFSPHFRGLGFATEATAAMIDVAFGELHAHRVIAQLDARNDASRHVLERLGLRREAHLVRNEFVKGEWCDEFVYAVLEDEWVISPR
jgi:RimJ/RimL family protein N-acetyltransferase